MAIPTSPKGISEEQWFTFFNSLYIVAVIIAALGSFFVYHFGKKVSRSNDQKISLANQSAQEAILKQKQADLEIERLRQDNLKLKIELQKLNRTSDRRWDRITGGTIDH